MTTSDPRINQMAMASLAAAVIGAIGWRLVGGWAALSAGALSLILGFLALRRRNGHGRKARWAAVIGIAFGAVVYAILIVTVTRDLVDPVRSF